MFIIINCHFFYLLSLFKESCLLSYYHIDIKINSLKKVLLNIVRTMSKNLYLDLDLNKRKIMKGHAKTFLFTKIAW